MMLDFIVEQYSFLVLQDYQRYLTPFIVTCAFSFDNKRKYEDCFAMNTFSGATPVCFAADCVMYSDRQNLLFQLI